MIKKKKIPKTITKKAVELAKNGKAAYIYKDYDSENLKVGTYKDLHDKNPIPQIIAYYCEDYNWVLLESFRYKLNI